MGRAKGSPGYAGTATFSQIPYHEATKRALITAINIGLASIHIVLRFYRGEEEFFTKWSTREVYPVLLKLMGKKPTVTRRSTPRIARSKVPSPRIASFSGALNPSREMRSSSE